MYSASMARCQLCSLIACWNVCGSTGEVVIKAFFLTIPAFDMVISWDGSWRVEERKNGWMWKYQ